MALAVEIDNHGIPPLAGICGYEEAARAGLSVEACVQRLKRYNYVLRRLHEVSAAHLPSTPEWEVKCALSLHLWLDAEHSSAIRGRVAEMREPPLHLDAVPDGKLEAALEEVIRCDGTGELLAGCAEARRALLAAIDEHLGALNPLFDHPTRRALRTILFEQEEMLEWTLSALAALTADEDERERADLFSAHVRAYLAAAGGIAGTAALPPPSELPPSRWDGERFEMDAEPRRDGRFIDRFNATARIDEYFADESRPTDERTWALAYKRLREMDVPEWMAPILYKTRGKPWAYYTDLGRQLWDEARHAMMGEVALVSLGVPFYAYPIDWASSVSLNREFTPLEAHVLLWRIEQGLMPRQTGKRFEWSVAGLHEDEFFIALQDYDWADEVLHARIGRRWLRDEHPRRAELTRIADELMERWNARLDAYAEKSSGEEWWTKFLDQARESRAVAG
jgi:hypothetical protein